MHLPLNEWKGCPCQVSRPKMRNVCCTTLLPIARSGFRLINGIIGKKKITLLKTGRKIILAHLYNQPT